MYVETRWNGAIIAADVEIREPDSGPYGVDPGSAEVSGILIFDVPGGIVDLLLTTFEDEIREALIAKARELRKGR